MWGGVGGGTSGESRGGEHTRDKTLCMHSALHRDGWTYGQKCDKMENECNVTLFGQGWGFHLTLNGIEEFYGKASFSLD